MSAARVYIDGAAGTTGLEIHNRLSSRSEFDLYVLPDDKRKDADARAQAIEDSDFTILCLPDDAAREAVAMASSGTRIIDASSAHRVTDGWTYGFPELTREQRSEIAKSARVSNPGCYPTGFLALVAPLVASGVIAAAQRLTVNAVSGYSGGGKALIERFEAEPEIAFRAYGLNLDHKHLPEMRLHAGLDHAPIFAPAVVPAYRGMLVEVPVHLDEGGSGATVDDVRRTLIDHYRDEPLVRVMAGDLPAELLINQGAAGDDGLVLAVAGDSSGHQARLIAMLDNLGKGASGAAVQNLNIMAGVEELAGLRLPD